jgi:epoxide hydrolase-like predicted phosphatase
MNYSFIKNIIFDLGGVVIDIDFDLTFSAFAQLANHPVAQTKKIMSELNIWDRYERGELTDQKFIDIIRESLSLKQSDQEIIVAWNALLLELPKRRIDLVKEINSKYITYVLSNTSNIHIEGVNKILEKSTGEKDLKNVFGKVYYSYEINRRKPDLDIYEFVLEDAGLKAEETLFLDDNLDNILAAQKVGIQTIHVHPPICITKYLENVMEKE